VSAELKLLRYLQERVNKSTKDFEGRPADQKQTDAGNTDAKQLSGKQERVEALMRRLADKLAKENETEEGR
jgi:Tfp pilus assembly major pilin PilA